MDNKEKNPTSILKKISNGIQQNRKNIENDAELTENLTSIKGNFGQIEGVIRNQVPALDTMKKFSKEVSSESAKNLQVKKFFHQYCQRAKVEFKALFGVVKEHFAVSLKSKSGESWEKGEKELEKALVNIREESESAEKIYAAVARINAAKDWFLVQFMRLMIYKKNVLWRDLNAPYDDYIHGDIKNAINLIKSNEQKLGYIPSTLDFSLPRFDVEAVEANLSQLLRIVMTDHQELIDGLKNYSKLSQQPEILEDISKNQVIVKGLRQRIELLSRNYESLTQKYRAMQINRGKSGSGNEEKSLMEKLQEMETVMIKKEQEIIELKQIGMKQDSLMNVLRDKNRELQDELSKWHKYQIPKLKELEGNQKSILDEFNKVRRDLETYSNLLQNEREEKIKTLEDLKVEKKRVHDMANILGRERRKIKELKQEITRQEKIVLALADKLPDNE